MAEDLSLYPYPELLECLKKRGYERAVDTGSFSLDHFNTNIVTPYTVLKGTVNPIIHIFCPCGELLAVCGFKQSGINTNDFIKSPNLYETPHFIAIRCTDKDNQELSAGTLIEIMKQDRGEGYTKLYTEFYGDLAFRIDGRLRRKEERYYFKDTVILQSGERLLFRAVLPEIDIIKTELLMRCDLFRNLI